MVSSRGWGGLKYGKGMKLDANCPPQLQRKTIEMVMVATQFFKI